jgi:hypothetical protein
VMDRNHDGIINNGTELFGTATQTASGGRAGNGYLALAQEDSNHDGKITALDTHFKDMKVWVDANGDGKTDAGELHALKDLGIVELDLNATSGTTVDNGNLLGLVSSYKTADGSSHEMADVWFSKDGGTSTTTTATTTAATTVADTTHLDATHTAAAAGSAGSTTVADNTATAATHATTAQPTATGTLGVSVHDLLSDRGNDILAGHAATETTPAANVNATTTVVQVDHSLNLIPIDHTQLIDDKQNPPLI